jgi:enoyl-CoA hydratase
MKDMSFTDVYLGNFLSTWDKVSEFRKPMIAAVSGYCLGGGCELALMCDFIIAADTAKFGLPEITLGIIPGSGGTQRLARSIGKAKAMEMILTGRLMEAAEAESCGLVSRIVAPDKLLDEAVATAAKIATFSQPVAMMAKEAVNRAFETSLAEGLRFERRLMHSMFALEDQKEGMSAFVEKRKPDFKNR